MFEDLADAVIYEAVNGRFNLDLGSLQSLIRTGNKLGQDGGSISAITIGPLLTMELELRLGDRRCNINARGRVSYRALSYSNTLLSRDKKSDRGSLKPVMAENWVINV